MRLAGPVALLVFAFGLACGGGSGPAMPLPVPTPVPAGAVTGPDCVSFCHQSATCFASEGRPVGPDETDCERSCAPGGTYAAMGAAAFLCAMKPCGTTFDECSGNAVVSLLSAAMSGAPIDPPATWPTGFPWLAGGVPHDVGMGGPLAVTTLLFPIPPADLADVVRAEGKRTGWMLAGDETVDVSQPGTSGKVRMSFTKDGASVSVTVYAAEGQTVLLVMH